jgi:methylenetetrahydrofolate dehydrogenase (NADP+) / methenyltetrahydrofolate cyclohydrolase
MLVDGRQIAQDILGQLKGRGAKRLVFVVLRDDPAIKSFVSMKVKVAESLGIRAEIVDGNVATTEEAIEVVRGAVKNDVDGVVVQLPLPLGVDTQSVLDAVPVLLDVDVLSTQAKLEYREGHLRRTPPVAGAVDQVFKKHRVDLMGKRVVVLGKGRLVGEPVAMLLDREGIPYTSLDEATPKDELYEEVAQADVLITGIGKPHFIKPEMVKNGAIIIDAGASGESGALRGDVDPSCAFKASLMTPVPNGLGPITIAVLFSNLW